MSSQRHVILRQTVELAITREADAWSLQQEASRILRKLQPVLEVYCNELSSSDRLHRIDRLELDLGTLDRSNLEEAISLKFSEALRQGLAEQIARQESADISPMVTSQLELFTQFTRYGNFPWWADHSQTNLFPESLDYLLRNASVLLRQLLPELTRDSRALQRLVGYLDNQRLAALVFLSAPALADSPLALFEALLALPEYWPTLAMMPPSHFRNHLWQSILGNATLSVQPPTDLLDFSRQVMRHLAHLQAVPYFALVRGLTETAAAVQFPGAIQAIVVALDAERRLGTVAESIGEAPHSPLWSRTISKATLETLQPWLAQGIPDPAPSGLQLWPRSLREAVFARLTAMGEAMEEALTALWGWFDQDLRGQMPPWIQEWPSLLREEFIAQLLEVDKQSSVGATARHEISPLQPTKSVLAEQWQKILQQAGRDDADEICLDNAGLVILWPFLKSFFERLNLLKNHDFSDAATQQRAVALLQYLANEDPKPPEYLLPLNKVLCGMALESVFALDAPLSETEIAECNTLLAAVIVQAPILNNMSIQGFRGSFLLRAGILEVRDGAWLLRVERETYDLVLDRFPWNFEWVKLPWMEAPLRVEW